jgi:small nuclear ribonucleoprotein (snRNP)-like protein
MSFRSIVVVLLVGVFLASPARAQGQTDLWRAFAEKLPPGAFVVVRLTNGSTVKGHLVEVMPEMITVLPKTRLQVPVRVLAFADIEWIDRQKEGMSPGAKVLAGAGAAGGILMAVVFAMLASGGWD